MQARYKWRVNDEILSGLELEVITAWAGFPANETPRPIVLLDERVRIGRAGFIDGASKIAFSEGNIRSEVEMPDGVLAMLTTGRIAVSADAPLVVTRVDAAHAEFITDRGLRQLPAYRLQITGMKAPCHVLDPTTPIWWEHHPTERPHRGWQRAHVETNGRRVRVTVFGGALTEFLGVTFVERDTVAMARPETRERQVPPGTAVRGGGIIGEVIGTLAAALGGRVLIDQHGLPYEVLTS
jgi:hypothetical protein